MKKSNLLQCFKSTIIFYPKFKNYFTQCTLKACFIELVFCWKEIQRDFPGSPVVMTSCFQYRGAGFSLWSELRSHMLCSVAKKLKKKKNFFLKEISQKNNQMGIFLIIKIFYCHENKKYTGISIIGIKCLLSVMLCAMCLVHPLLPVMSEI